MQGQLTMPVHLQQSQTLYPAPPPRYADIVPVDERPSAPLQQEIAHTTQKQELATAKQPDTEVKADNSWEGREVKTQPQRRTLKQAMADMGKYLYTHQPTKALCQFSVLGWKATCFVAKGSWRLFTGTLRAIAATPDFLMKDLPKFVEKDLPRIVENTKIRSRAMASHSMSGCFVGGAAGALAGGLAGTIVPPFALIAPVSGAIFGAGMGAGIGLASGLAEGNQEIKRLSQERYNEQFMSDSSELAESTSKKAPDLDDFGQRFESALENEFTVIIKDGDVLFEHNP